MRLFPHEGIQGTKSRLCIIDTSKIYHSWCKPYFCKVPIIAILVAAPVIVPIPPILAA